MGAQSRLACARRCVAHLVARRWSIAFLLVLLAVGCTGQAGEFLAGPAVAFIILAAFLLFCALAGGLGSSGESFSLMLLLLMVLLLLGLVLKGL